MLNSLCIFVLFCQNSILLICSGILYDRHVLDVIHLLAQYSTLYIFNDIHLYRVAHRLFFTSFWFLKLTMVHSKVNFEG